MRGRFKTWLLIVAGATLGAGAVALLDYRQSELPPLVLAPTSDAESKADPSHHGEDADSNYEDVMSALALLAASRRELASGNLPTALALSRQGEARLVDLLSANPWLLDQLSRTKLVEARMLEGLGRIQEAEAARTAFVQYRIAYFETFDPRNSPGLNDLPFAGNSRGVLIRVEDLSNREVDKINSFRVCKTSGGHDCFDRQPGVPRLFICTNDLLGALVCRSGEG